MLNAYIVARVLLVIPSKHLLDWSVNFRIVEFCQPVGFSLMPSTLARNEVSRTRERRAFREESSPLGPVASAIGSQSRWQQWATPIPLNEALLARWTLLCAGLPTPHDLLCAGLPTPHDC